MGKKDGIWKAFNRKGTVLNEVTYKDGVDLAVIEAKKKKDEEAKKASEKKDKKGGAPGPQGTQTPPVVVDPKKK